MSDIQHIEFHGFNSNKYEFSTKFLVETVKIAVISGTNRALMTRKSAYRFKDLNLSSTDRDLVDDDAANSQLCKASEMTTKVKYNVPKEGKVMKNIPTRSYFPLNIVIFFMVLMLKLISIQFSLFTHLFTIPIRLSYNFVMFAFRSLMCMNNLLIIRLSKTCFELLSCSTSFIYARILGNKSIINLGFILSRTLFRLVCACFVLVGLLCVALLVGGIATKRLVEEPMKTTETLNFDYMKDSPVALVPVNLYIHEMQLTIVMRLPESDYNRELGMFQVRVDLLSNNGKVTATTRHPCMLKFKSPLVRCIETIFKVAPVIAGFQTESQIVEMKIRDLGKGYNYKHTGYLKVSLEQRAGYSAGAGIPQIYDASLNIESELSKWKTALWFWRRIVFLWLTLVAFWIELVTVLIFFGCHIIRVKAEQIFRKPRYLVD